MVIVMRCALLDEKGLTRHLHKRRRTCRHDTLDFLRRQMIGVLIHFSFNEGFGKEKMKRTPTSPDSSFYLVFSFRFKTLVDGQIDEQPGYFPIKKPGCMTIYL